MGVEPIFMSPPDRRAGNEKISEAKSKSDRNIIFLPKMTLPGIEPVSVKDTRLRKEESMKKCL